MNSKNIFITIGIIAIGLILYKLLLGLVLPIVLFVSLGYVLKFLLKGSDSEGELEVSQILKNSSPNSSIENVVEIQPIKEDKPVEESKSVEEDKPVEESKSVEEDKPDDGVNIGPL